MQPERLVICEHCDAVYRRQALPGGAVACCRRCGAELYRNRRYDLDTMLAITLAALILFVIANLHPVVRMELGGSVSEATLWDAILASSDAGVGPVAVVAAACIFFLPLSQMLLFAYVLLPLRTGAVPRHFVTAMHAIRHMRPWSMVEVFMVGVLVSAVKLAADAEIAAGIGLWGFALLTVLLTMLSTFNLHELWDLASEVAP